MPINFFIVYSVGLELDQGKIMIMTVHVIHQQAHVVPLSCHMVKGLAGRELPLMVLNIIKIPLHLWLE